MVSPDPASPIVSLLASLLPSSISLTLHHLSTPPTKTLSLFSPPPGQKAPTTTLETHFLSISHDGILVFAIEVLIYTTAKTSSRTFFVSKADSSGYLSPELASFTTSTGGRQSTLRTISTAFIRYLFGSFREADPTISATISLFARSQTQYLFPNSAVNEKKHVLTDRGLISWWCKVLDPILQEYASSSGGAKGYLLVPGFDHLETRPLFPPARSATQEKWANGHPYKLDAEADITVREVIPHFPDDPKARFLDELGSDEKMDKAKSIVQRGQGWKDVRTIEQFWELMSFRQECSLGRCVGFLWIVLDGEGEGNVKAERKIKIVRRASLKPLLTPEGSQLQPDVATTEPRKEPEKAVPTPSPPQLDTSATAKPDLQPLITTITTEQASTPDISPESSNPAVFSPTLSPTSPTSPRKSNKRPSTSNTVPTSPTKKLRTTNPMLQPILSSTTPVKPLILLDEKQYTRVIDSLLNHADFGDKENARRSSSRWLEGAAIAAGKEGAEKEAWGVDVKGSLVVEDPKTVTPTAVGTVNVLAVQKKPKPAEAPVVNMLPTSLIRKKPAVAVLATEVAKTTAEVEKEVDRQGRVVNLLAAGLMRKKAKPAVPEEVRAEAGLKVVGETERLKKTEEAQAEVDKAGRKVNVLGKELMRRKEKAVEEAAEVPEVKGIGSKV